MPRRRLVIETATAACSVALVDEAGQETLAERHEVVGRGHAERLMPMIADLLGTGRADAVSVDCGPGSFTGVRVGLAAARALGLAWRVPVSGFSSLALIAAGEGRDGVGVAITGGHGELFVQRFGGVPPRALGAMASLAPDQAARAIPDPLVLGSGAAPLVLARGSGEAQDRLPRAADWLRLDPAARALPAEPLYGRAPDAVPGGRR